MSKRKQPRNYRHSVADKVSQKEDLHKYEESFRRWLGGELNAGRITPQQAVREFKIEQSVVYHVRQAYQNSVDLSLPVMTEEEKKKLEKQQQKIKELEKQLQDAQVKNIALETLIDVAEKDLNIKIRKKPGAKQ
jgi:transposase